MKSKPRKTISIELICISILSVLPLGGNSLHIDSTAKNYDKNYIKWNEINKPTTFSVPIEDLKYYNEGSIQYRHKRSAQGKISI